MKLCLRNPFNVKQDYLRIPGNTNLVCSNFGEGLHVSWGGFPGEGFLGWVCMFPAIIGIMVDVNRIIGEPPNYTILDKGFL